MHRCLFISEIVENICDHLGYLGPDLEGSRSLAALARTCRGFEGPALDHLWANQHDMWNLLRCMPPDLFAFKKHGSVLDVRLLRPIVATDWVRPLLYMRRIRHMLVFGNSSIPNILPALSASLPRDVGSAFPKLATVYWFHRKDFSCIQIFLSSRITSLSIFCELSTTDLSLLSTIPRTCPALKQLTVRHHGHTGPGRGSALSSCLRGLHSLESVDIQIPDMAVLNHLSQLRGLASLVADLPDNLSSSPPLPPLRFIGLESLVLGAEIEPVICFFRRCSGVTLKDITIDLHSCSTTAAIKRLHTALREGCSHASLSSLNIDNGESNPLPAEDAMTDMQSIRLLFCFANITSFSIASYVGFSITDDEMKELAHSWPQVRELQFQLAPSVEGTYPHPRLSLCCLRTLAEYCQALTELELTLDATFIPESDPNASSTTRRCSQSALSSLKIGKSPISESLSVARFISAIFPNVSQLGTDRSDCDNTDPEELEEYADAIAFHNMWMEVETQIPVLAAIREEGRSWALEELGTE
ncbi:hypothetical protein K438DRAFT_1811465 [Mycena galopus ATCC 62051]|nr:hypothetical protein K438DRAFT_1811465 [Mycena galopus ATCC 62051]